MAGIEVVDSLLPKVLVIGGPTASGKTSLALKIAEHIPSEIISADSRQVYRYLDIGTAKPTKEELLSVPHHGIDIREPDEKFNAGEFQGYGRDKINEIIRRKRLPIIVGGTGLYIRAVIDGFFEQPEFSGDIRSALEERLKMEGPETLFAELQSIDPVSASSMDPTKFRRVIRALEVYHETGIPISRFHERHTSQKIYDTFFIALEWERPVLYDRINRRVDAMISNGFLEEVKQIQKMGFDDRFQSLQTVGYKEAFAYFRKEISLERMIELMKQNSRRFAKRQTTWFRKESRIQWFAVDEGKKLSSVETEIIEQAIFFLNS